MITTMPRPPRPETAQPAAASSARWRFFVLIIAGAAAAICAADSHAQDPPATSETIAAPTETAPGQPLVSWTESEKAALRVAVGRPQTKGGSALYMLLAKAATLAPLTDAQWSTLDQAAYTTLVNEPERDTGRPIRLQLRVQLLQKLVAGSDEMGAAYNWRQGTPAWRIDAMEAQAMVHGEQLPIHLFCVQDPMPVLGDPLWLDGEELVYGAEGKGLSRSKAGPLVEVAGLYFKAWETELRGDGADGTISLGSPVARVPFLIVWDMRRIRGGRADLGGASGTPRTIFFITLIVMVFVIFYLLKRTVRQRRRTDRLATMVGRGAYQPLRNVDSDDDPEARRDEEEEAVDPDLAAAAEAYRREREQENPDA